MEVFQAGPVFLDSLTIHSAGPLSSPYAAVNGYGILVTTSTVTLTQSVIQNFATGIGFGSLPGPAQGEVVVSNSTLRNNQVGLDGNCGQVLIVDRSTIDNPVSNDQGWAIVSSGVLTLTRSVVVGSVLITTGVGSDHLYDYCPGTGYIHSTAIRDGQGDGLKVHAYVDVYDSAITGHSGNGVVVNFSCYRTSAFVALNNTTVSSNGGAGVYVNYGGYVDPHCTLRPARLSSSTVANNVRGLVVDSREPTLHNTIVFGNTDYDIVACSEFVSEGYNLVGVLSASSGCGHDAAGDQVNVDPRLFTLIGAPAFHPLRLGSPAIDAGDPAGCTDHNGKPLAGDQRGVARSGRCDIGAYEFAPSYDPLAYVWLPFIDRH